MKRKDPRRNTAKERLWRRTVRQWRRSGQSVRDYCRKHGLSEPSFYAWRRELKRRGRAPSGCHAEHGRASDRGRRRPAVRSRRGSRSAGRLLRAAGFVRVAAETAALPGCSLVSAAAIELALPSGAVLRWPAAVEPAAVVAVLSAWERSRC